MNISISLTKPDNTLKFEIHNIKTALKLINSYEKLKEKIRKNDIERDTLFRKLVELDSLLTELIEK